MARDTEARGPSVEDAVEAALAELGATEQEVRIEVLQEPKAGFLGVGGQEAVVRVRVTREELDMDALEEQADLAADFVEDLLAKMGIDATAEPNVVNDHMYVDILGDDEDDMALLIGRHGARPSRPSRSSPGWSSGGAWTSAAASSSTSRTTASAGRRR